MYHLMSKSPDEACDPDQLFAYHTNKVVRVQDRTFGLLRLMCLIPILSYILFWVLLDQKGYLVYDYANGAISASLQPVVDTVIDPADYPYCTAFEGIYTPKFERLATRLDGNNLFYNAIHGCITMDAGTTRHGTLSRINSFFIPTRIKETEQVKNCLSDQACSTPWVDTENPDFGDNFISGIESFELVIEHSMHSFRFIDSGGAYTGDNNDKGAWLDNSRNVFKEFPDAGFDRISVRDLLKTANIGFDVLTESDPRSTYRHKGFSLRIELSWSNNGNTEQSEYTYKVVGVHDTEDIAVQTTATPLNSTHRILTETYGIWVYFLPGGLLGKFEFQRLIGQIVTIFVLTGISSGLIDFCMLYCSANRGAYSMAKYAETEDSSDVQEKIELMTRGMDPDSEITKSRMAELATFSIELETEKSPPMEWDELKMVRDNTMLPFQAIIDEKGEPQLTELQLSKLKDVFMTLDMDNSGKLMKSDLIHVYEGLYKQIDTRRIDQMLKDIGLEPHEGIGFNDFLLFLDLQLMDDVIRETFGANHAKDEGWKAVSTLLHINIPDVLRNFERDGGHLKSKLHHKKQSFFNVSSVRK